MDIPLKPLHVGISVPDMEASLAWYRDVLGFSLRRRAHYDALDAEIAIIGNGAMQIELFEYDEPCPLPKSRREPNEDLKTVGTKHFCFTTPDLKALLAHFEKHSVDIVFANEGLTGKTPHVLYPGQRRRSFGIHSAGGRVEKRE